MGRLSGTEPAVWFSKGFSGGDATGFCWAAALFSLGILLLAVACVIAGSPVAAIALSLTAVAVAVLWALPARHRGGRTDRQAIARQMVNRATLADPDLYLDLDLVEVQAVYRLDTELYAHLKGGIGQRLDPATGDRRSIETSDVSLTWRCSGRRMAEKLVSQLNQWEARGTPLRLLAMRGRCALLIEDDSNWVALPELRLAA